MSRPHVLFLDNLTGLPKMELKKNTKLVKINHFSLPKWFILSNEPLWQIHIQKLKPKKTNDQFDNLVFFNQPRNEAQI